MSFAAPNNDQHCKIEKKKKEGKKEEERNRKPNHTSVSGCYDFWWTNHSEKATRSEAANCGRNKL